MPPGGLEIVDLDPENEALVKQVARLMLDGLREHATGWLESLDDALD